MNVEGKEVANANSLVIVAGTMLVAERSEPSPVWGTGG